MDTLLRAMAEYRELSLPEVKKKYYVRVLENPV